MEVVQLRASPKLTDIPGQLRQLADRIEKGEVEAESVLCIVPQDGDWPIMFGWGDHMTDHGNIAICELAKAWFINNRTSR
jgi:hypothetical protein